MKKKNKIDLKKIIALNLFRKYRHNLAEIHELKYLFWECTLRCNMNCVHCGSDCTKDSSVNDMPVADFIRVIDEIKPTVNPNKTMIVLTGGEPLVRKDIEIVGKELYNRGFPWGIVSNGFLLTKNRLDSLLNAGLRALTISLDGLEEIHTWFRGTKNAYPKVLEAIKNAAKLENLEFDVVTCANQRSFKELNQIKNLLIETGVKQWRIFTVFPIGRAVDNPLLFLSDIEFKELFDFIKETREEGKIVVSYGCEGFLGNYEAEVRDEFFFCQAGISVGSVLVDGSISACPSLRDNYIQGNIYNDNFVEVWNNKFQVMRNRKWTKTGKCAECEAYKWCEGNGLHLRNEKNGELLFCHLEKINNAL
ncbi:MAG: TIGR04133 family radical SAM/SPASM protein [Bacteroidales bacterium]|nr:TIGR04133 family radical SAM/SPASM protein [Bacteroidales bacterium]